MKALLNLKRQIVIFTILAFCTFSNFCLVIMLSFSPSMLLAQSKVSLKAGEEYKLVLKNGGVYEGILEEKQANHCLLKVGNRRLHIMLKDIESITTLKLIDEMESGLNNVSKRIDIMDTMSVSPTYFNFGAKLRSGYPLLNAAIGFRFNKKLGLMFEGFGLKYNYIGTIGVGANFTYGNNYDAFILGSGLQKIQVKYLGEDTQQYYKLGYFRYFDKRSKYFGLDLICYTGGCIPYLKFGLSY